MKILINATSARLGGGITVFKNLLPALVKADGGANEYVVAALADVVPALDPGNPRIRFEPLRGKGLGARLWWEQGGIRLRAMSEGADLIFSPANVGVIGSRTPQVLMFQNFAPYDASVVERASPAKRRRFRVLKWMGAASARNARRVVFISRFAEHAILPQLATSPVRSRCIYLGHDVAFSPMAAKRAGPVKQRLGLAGPYILSVSHFYHYKNFVELVRGFARAQPHLPRGVVLAIAGGEHEPEYAARVRATIREEGVESSVRLLGEVPYSDLPPLYAAASLFVFPSSCENFPNILVEGMASGVPTLASRIGPMPEIAGEGAAYFDPFDPDDIARVVLRVFGSAQEGATLCAAALSTVQRFSWDDTARQLLGVFHECVNEAKPATTGESVKDLFDAKAKTWTEKYAVQGSLRYRLRDFTTELVDRTPPPADVLDFGCGTGDLARELQRLGYHVRGTDVSDAMLTEARRASSQIAWTLLEADWQKLPFEDGQFRAIVASSVLEYVPHIEHVLGELRRVLADGGVLVATIPDTLHWVRRAEAVARPLTRVVSRAVRERSGRLSEYRAYLTASRNRFPKERWASLTSAAGLDLQLWRSTSSEKGGRAPLAMMVLKAKPLRT